MLKAHFCVMLNVAGHIGKRPELYSAMKLGQLHFATKVVSKDLAENHVVARADQRIGQLFVTRHSRIEVLDHEAVLNVGQHLGRDVE